MFLFGRSVDQTCLLCFYVFPFCIPFNEDRRCGLNPIQTTGIRTMLRVLHPEYIVCCNSQQISFASRDQDQDHSRLSVRSHCHQSLLLPSTSALLQPFFFTSIVICVCPLAMKLNLAGLLRISTPFGHCR